MKASNELELANNLYKSSSFQLCFLPLKLYALFAEAECPEEDVTKAS